MVDHDVIRIAGCSGVDNGDLDRSEVTSIGSFGLCLDRARRAYR